MRSFGMRFGYYNASDWAQNMFVDPIMDTWGDIMDGYSKILFEADKAEPTEKFVEIAGKFNALVEANFVKHEGKYCAGNSVTIADFVLASYVGNFVNNSQ